MGWVAIDVGRRLLRWPWRWVGARPLPRLVQAPSPNQASRGGVTPDLIVIHDTEGAYAAAVAWLRNPQAQASAHIVLREDGREASQLVPWSQEAWTEEAYNARGLSLELAGRASIGYPGRQVRSAAAVVAYWCHLFSIPARDSLGGVRPGIARHSDLGQAGGGHHDPGPLFRWRLFLALVRLNLDRGTAPAIWGQG